MELDLDLDFEKETLDFQKEINHSNDNFDKEIIEDKIDSKEHNIEKNDIGLPPKAVVKRPFLKKNSNNPKKEFGKFKKNTENSIRGGSLENFNKISPQEDDINLKEFNSNNEIKDLTKNLRKSKLSNPAVDEKLEEDESNEFSQNVKIQSSPIIDLVKKTEQNFELLDSIKKKKNKLIIFTFKFLNYYFFSFYLIFLRNVLFNFLIIFLFFLIFA